MFNIEKTGYYHIGNDTIPFLWNIADGGENVKGFEIEFDEAKKDLESPILRYYYGGVVGEPGRVIPSFEPPIYTISSVNDFTLQVRFEDYLNSDFDGPFVHEFILTKVQ